MIADVALDRRHRRREDQGGESRQHHHRRRHRRHHRQDRREHDAAPRGCAVSVGKGVIGNYVHNSVATGLARSACWSRSNSSGKADELASARPPGRDARRLDQSAWRSMPSGLDPAVIKREKDVLADKFRQQGKPDNVIEKIVEFGPQDLLQGSLLLEQPFIFDDSEEERRAGAEGSRRQGRRADQGHRLRALRARRRHREAGNRFRRRGRGCRGAKLIRSTDPQSEDRKDELTRPTDASSSSSPAKRSPAPRTSASTSRPSSASPPIWWRRRSSASSSASWSAAATSSAASKSPRAACRARSATPWACWRR